MKRRVSFTVEPSNFPEADCDYSFASAMSRIVECLVSIGEEVPKVPYRVTYTLAEKHGRLTCYSQMAYFIRPYHNRRDGTRWDAPIICQIPKEWLGLRFNRKVTPL